MPVIHPTQTVPDSLFPYDERNKYKGEGAIHFFAEDGEFESVWLRSPRHPHYPSVVGKAGRTLTPDWSVYTDFPVATQIWNVWRSRLMGALWQYQGIDVIPSVVWGDSSTFDWCFDGLPIGGVLAVSTAHIARHEQRGFLDGFVEMVERLKPTTVLVYGRGLRGELEYYTKVKRYDSRLTQIYNERQQKKQGQMALL